MTPRVVSTRAGWGAVAVCAVFAGGVSVGVMVEPPLGVALAIALGATALCLGLRLAAARRAMLVLLVGLAASAGLARGAEAVAPAAAWVHALRGSPAVLAGTVRDGTGSRRSPGQVIVDVDRVVHADGDQAVRGGVLASLRSGEAVLTGDRVQLATSRLRLPRTRGAESVLPAEGVVAVAESPALTVEAQGGASPSRTLAQVRAALASAVDKTLPQPAAPLLEAIVFGFHRPLPADLSDALRDSGLAHLLAVSGLKVAVVVSMVAAACAAAALSPRTRLLLSGAAVGSYVVVSGGGAAAVRSALMAGAAWGLRGTGRTIDSLPLLSAVAALMLAVDPGLCRDVGFQLSFLGTLGIVVLANPIADRLVGPRLLLEPFAVTVAAQVATVPVMASTFGVLSLAAPLANAIAVPLLPPLIALGAGGGVLTLVWPPLGWVPLQASGLLCTVVAGIARRTAAMPLAALHVSAWPRVLVVAELLALVVALATWRGVAALRRGVISDGGGRATAMSYRGTAGAVGRRPLPRRTAAALAASAAVVAGGASLAVAGRADDRFHVAVLDAGSGRAVLVQTSGGARALVDAGADAQHLLDALGAALPPLTRRIDLLVLTGSDRTAAGGIDGLASHYAIERAVVPDGALDGAVRAGLAVLGSHDTAVEKAKAGAAWAWAGAAWRLLGDPDASPPQCALEIVDGASRVLLLGGLPVDTQEEVAALGGTALRADLLVAPPGGLLAPALLDAARPRFIAIPGGRGSRAAAPALLDGPGVRRTADAGTLTYTGGDGGLTPT